MAATGATRVVGMFGVLAIGAHAIGYERRYNLAPRGVGIAVERNVRGFALAIMATVRFNLVGHYFDGY